MVQRLPRMHKTLGSNSGAYEESHELHVRWFHSANRNTGKLGSVGMTEGSHSSAAGVPWLVCGYTGLLPANMGSH